MSCMDVMQYQSGLSSCFPGSFSASNYANSTYQPHAATSTGTPAASSKTTTTGESTLKKFGSSRMYADRYHPYSISSPVTTSRQNESIPAAGSSCSVTSSNNSMSVTSTHSRVGSCISDAGRSSSSAVATTRSGKEAPFEEEKAPIVQYTTPTAYLLIHHLGDVTGAVEDHFTRALNPSNYGKNSLPMTSRNLPPSFYDPSIAQAPQLMQQCHSATYGLPYHGYPSTSSDYSYTDSYYPSTFHPAAFQHPPADSWHYAAYNSVAAQSLTAQRAAAMQQMTADFTVANRFNSSSYNSLISQGIFPTTPVMRTPRIDKTGANWSTHHSVFGAEVPHYSTPSDYDYQFAGKAPSSKEFLWH